MLSAKFIDAVKTKDVIGVKTIMKNAILMDRTLADFNEMENHINAFWYDLYDTHDDSKIKPISEWTEDDLYSELEGLFKCFSKERINAIKEAVRTKFSDNVSKNSVENNTKSNSKSGTLLAYLNELESEKTDLGDRVEKHKKIMDFVNRIENECKDFRNHTSDQQQLVKRIKAIIGC